MTASRQDLEDAIERLWKAHVENSWRGSDPRRTAKIEAELASARAALAATLDEVFAAPPPDDPPPDWRPPWE